MFEESKRVVDGQVSASEQLDAKAANVVRYASVILGIEAGGQSVLGISQNVSMGVLAVLGLGGVALLLAIVFGLRAYQANTYQVGLKGLHNALDDNLPEAVFLREAIQAYHQGHQENDVTLAKTGAWLTRANITLATGLVLSLFGLAASATAIWGQPA